MLHDASIKDFQLAIDLREQFDPLIWVGDHVGDDGDWVTVAPRFDDATLPNMVQMHAEAAVAVSLKRDQ